MMNSFKIMKYNEAIARLKEIMEDYEICLKQYESHIRSGKSTKEEQLLMENIMREIKSITGKSSIEHAQSIIDDFYNVKK